MNTFAKVATLFLIVFTIGCGGKAEDIASRTLAAMKEVNAALESGDKDRIKNSLTSMQTIAKEAKETKVSKSESEKVAQKYKPLIEEEGKKLISSMMKAASSGKLSKADLEEIGRMAQSLKQ